MHSNIANLPKIPTNPRPFEPTGRLTQERIEALRIDDNDFLWPEEKLLVVNLLMLQEGALAWTEQERGTFDAKYFDPIRIPTVEHVPWVHKNIPIPPGIFDEVVRIIKDKIASGVYEPSNSSYRSRWFCIVKKDGKSLRLVHDLQPLNKVSIRDPSVPYPT